MINTQVIYRVALALVECKIKDLLNICKRNITSLLLFVGTTVIDIIPLLAPNTAYFCDRVPWL